MYFYGMIHAYSQYMFSFAPLSTIEKRSFKINDIIGNISSERKTQSRFLFHVERCIGCHTCEIACAEQNALPEGTAWRRVGELEGGIFPDVKRYFVSLSCNHCLDAPCMNGCPVDAYSVNDRGIVIHNDPQCIGCGYCVWNCPYGVPVFQKDRKIVTKCDMCSNRLDQGLDPACVEACPTNAIQVEEVSVDEIKNTFMANADVPDMPSPLISVPSTKIILPESMNPEEFKKTDYRIIRSEDPHFSLILMTVFTQLSVGGFLLSFISDILRTIIPIPESVFRSVSFTAPVLFGIAGLSLLSSTFHLGRPLLAYRAIKKWKTSWLSREVIGLGVFSGLASVYSLMLFYSGGQDIRNIYMNIGIPSVSNSVRLLFGALTIFTGIFGIYASSKIYRVMSRPAWNSVKTTFDFFLISLLSGGAVFSHAASIAAIMDQSNEFLSAVVKVFSISIVVIGGVSVLVDLTVLRYRENSPVRELSQNAELYGTVLYRENAIRLLFLGVASVLSIMTGVEYFKAGTWEYAMITFAALIFYVLYSIMSRYLFFVTVVPSNIPGNYIVKANKPSSGRSVPITEARWGQMGASHV